MKKLKMPKVKILGEFKTFITRGNVIDLAVGMIIGAAFTAIVNGLVNNIFKPLINAIPMGGVNGLITMLVPKDATGAIVAVGSAAVDMTQSVFIDWGAFIMAIINFLLTAVVLFFVVKAINTFRDGFGKFSNEFKHAFKDLSTEEYKELKKQGYSRKQIKEMEAQKAVDKKAAEEAEAAAKAAAEPKPETTEDLLKQIRDMLKLLQASGQAEGLSVDDALQNTEE